MGNNDGMSSAIGSMGTNQVIDFKGGYFSFAFGDEIALCLKRKAGKDFYILNCNSLLWDDVKKFLESKPTLAKIKKFWIGKLSDYEVSEWSHSFDGLKKRKAVK